MSIHFLNIALDHIQRLLPIVRMINHSLLLYFACALQDDLHCLNVEDLIVHDQNFVLEMTLIAASFALFDTY